MRVGDEYKCIFSLQHIFEIREKKIRSDVSKYLQVYVFFAERIKIDIGGEHFPQLQERRKVVEQKNTFQDTIHVEYEIRLIYI